MFNWWHASLVGGATRNRGYLWFLGHALRSASVIRLLSRNSVDVRQAEADFVDDFCADRSYISPPTSAKLFLWRAYGYERRTELAVAIVWLSADVTAHCMKPANTDCLDQELLTTTYC